MLGAWVRRVGVGTVVSWTAVGLVGLVALVSVVSFDFRDRQLAGDQASFVLQTLSIAHEGNLSYGPSDIDRWRSLQWPNADHPYGLHLQRYEDGWAFAKPYGYSLLAAPVVRSVGPVPGFAIVNAALTAALFALAVLILRLHLRGAAVPLIAGAYVFGSHVVFWAYPVTTDLFLAVAVAFVVYAALRALRDTSLVWLLVALAAGAFVTTEKVTVLGAIAPLLVVSAARVWTPRRGPALLGVFVGIAVLSIVPYLHYSDGSSWTAYGGDRYVIQGPAPFEPGVPSAPRPAGTSEPFELGFIIGEIAGVGSESFHAALTYLVGRHTGLLPFMPVALVAVGLSLVHIRSSDRAVVAALSIGLAAYVGLYVVVLTDNYFGGGQSIGNRYFLQVSPLVLGLLAASKVPARHLVWGAIGSVAVSLALVPQHHRQPDRAFWRVTEISELQELLPFESTQRSAEFLRGGDGSLGSDRSGGAGGARSGAARVGDGVGRLWDRGVAPAHALGEGDGDLAPCLWVPALGLGGNEARWCEMHERRQHLELGGLHERTLGVAQREDLVGDRAEELLGLVLGARDDEHDATVGATEMAEDPRRRLEDPCAFVGVRIEHHRSHVEVGQPLAERALVVADRLEGEIEGCLGAHGATT